MYVAFSKVAPQTDGTIIVSGFASTPDFDRDGESITADAMRKAIPSYMRDGPALREMHRPIAAGRALHIEVMPDGRSFIQGHVVDRDTVAKVQAGVLRGFSVGGDILKRNKQNKNIIEEIKLKEVSLVDRPANPSCMITLAKFDKEGREPKLNLDIVRKIQSRKPQLFSDIVRKGHDVSAEPRDKDGEWTSGGNSSSSNSGSGKGVILEDRGTRRGKPWGTIAGAVGAGLIGAAVAAKNPSRLAAILAGAAAHGIGGAAAGAVRGARVPSSWPVRVAAAAGNSMAGAAVGAFRGASAGAERPKLYNAIMAGGLAGTAGAGIGGAVGEQVGAAHDRIRTTRLVDLNEKADSPSTLIKAAMAPHQRIAALAAGRKANPKAAPPAAHSERFQPFGNRVDGTGGAVGGPGIAKAENPLVMLAKFATNQPRDDQGQFASSGATASPAQTLALAGGFAGGMLADHFVGGVTRALPAPAALVARIAAAGAGEVVGHAIGHQIGAAVFGHDGSPGSDAAAAHARHTATTNHVEAIKAAMRNPTAV